MFPYLSNKYLPGIEDTIVLHLTAKDFVSARLVCKKWNLRIKKVMEKRSNRKIVFDQAWRLPIKYYAKIRFSNNIQTIQKCPTSGYPMILYTNWEIAQFRIGDFHKTDHWSLIENSKRGATFAKLLISEDVLLVRTSSNSLLYVKEGDDWKFRMQVKIPLRTGRMLCFKDRLLISFHAKKTHPVAYKIDLAWEEVRPLTPHVDEPRCLPQMSLFEIDTKSNNYVGLEEVAGSYWLHLVDGKSLECKSEIGPIVPEFGAMEPTQITANHPYVAVKFGNKGFIIWNVVQKCQVSELTFNDKVWVTDQLINDNNSFLYCIADYEGQQTHIFATSLDNSKHTCNPVRILHLPDRCLLRIAVYCSRLLVYKDLDNDVHGRELIVSDLWDSDFHFPNILNTIGIQGYQRTKSLLELDASVSRRLFLKQ
jgi:hypothetical protein